MTEADTGSGNSTSATTTAAWATTMSSRARRAVGMRRIRARITRMPAATSAGSTMTLP